MIQILLFGIAILFIIIGLIKQKKVINLIKKIESNDFYSESEKTLQLFTYQNTRWKKSSLVFLDDSLHNDSLDVEIASNRQKFRKMNINDFVSNIARYSEIDFILIYYEADSVLKKCSLKRDTFLELVKKISTKEN